MTDLKPCPFCGGEGTFSTVKLHNYSSDMSFYVDCDTCGCSTSYEDTGAEVINLWNTRQSSDNWKPIEELTEDVLRSINHVLLFHRKGYPCLFNIRCDYNGGIHINVLHEDEEDLPNIRKDYTHYALLTPPNQELKNE